MKQFTLLLELCQKTQKPLQSRDNSKSNPGKMKIRRTSIRNPGQKYGGSGMQTISNHTDCEELRHRRRSEMVLLTNSEISIFRREYGTIREKRV